MAIPLGTVIPAGISAIGGIFGGGAAARERQRAEQARRAALEAIMAVRMPTLEEQRLILESPELVEEYAPLLEAAPEELAPSAIEDITVDPRLREAQMQALAQMQELGETGMTMEERATLEEMLGQAAAQERARQASILQEMAQRGVAGGGQELAARMMSAQAGAAGARQQAMDLGAQAQQRALQAMTQAGAMSGRLRSQEYGEQSDVARARDVVNQFNLQQREQARLRNLSAQRAAAERNLAERQRLAEQAVNIQHAQEMDRQRLIRQQYEDEMARASAVAGYHTGTARIGYRQAPAVGEAWSRGATRFGELVGGILGAPEKRKDRITETAPQPARQPAAAPRPTAPRQSLQRTGYANPFQQAEDQELAEAYARNYGRV